MGDMRKLPTPKKQAGFAERWKTRLDGWENVITGLGTARDKRTGTRMKVTPFSASRDKFDEMYHGDDTSATIADLPAKEMVRKWITLQVDDSAENDSLRAGDVNDKMLTAKQVMQKLDDLKAKSKIARALIWARVHGGSLVFMGVDDGVEDLTEPLNPDNMKSVEFLLVFDRWEVQIQSTNDDIRSENFGKPETYLMQTQTETGIGTTESVEIHASRFLRFDGVPTARFRMARNGGWSDSVYVRMEETLQDWGISWTAITHLLQDFSQAVLKMKGLHEAICQQESNLVIDRMTTMDLCRSVARAIPIDADDEDFIRVTTPMGGLPETIDRLMLRVASAARMPATLLFGQSPAGLNATGDSDIRFFYDQIAAMQEEGLRPELDRLIELIFASKEGPTGGTEPENWSYVFNALWQMTDKEEAEVKKTTAETDDIYLGNGVLDQDEVAMSRFGGDTYSTETVLDMEKREAEPETEPPMMLPGVAPEPDESVVRLMSMLDFPAFYSTNFVNEHSHGVDIPRGRIFPGLYTTQKRDGHSHVVIVEEIIEVGQSVTLLTTDDDEHSHAITLEPFVADALHLDVIEKRGRKYVVMSKAGKVLGTHDTEEDAKKQLAAVEAAKARKE